MMACRSSAKVFLSLFLACDLVTSTLASSSMHPCAVEGDDLKCSASFLQHAVRVREDMTVHKQSKIRGIELSPTVDPMNVSFWTVAHKNKVYGGPAVVDAFVIYDIPSGKVSTLPTGYKRGLGFDWMGIAVDPDADLIYAAPHDSDYILCYDIKKNKISGTLVTAVGTGGGKFDGVTVYNGKAYAPPANANQILIHDGTSGQVWGAPTNHLATGEWKWAWGQGHEGNVFFGPNSVKSLLKYNINTQDVSGIPVALDHKWGWTGLTIHQNKIFLTPNADRVLYVYNIETQAVSNASTAAFPGFSPPIEIDGDGKKYSLAWGGGVGFGGKVYMGSYCNKNILVVDAETIEMSVISAESVPGGCWSGISISNNTLYQMPYTYSTSMLSVDIA